MANTNHFLIPKWSWSALIARSGLVKSISLIPLFGYLIIWSDQYSQLFQSTALGGTLWIQPGDSIYFVYWGAVIMTLGIGFYLIFCPRQIKRYRFVEEYIDETNRVNMTIEYAESLVSPLMKLDNFQTPPSISDVLGPEHKTSSNTERLCQLRSDLFKVVRSSMEPNEKKDEIIEFINKFYEEENKNLKKIRKSLNKSTLISYLRRMTGLMNDSSRIILNSSLLKYFNELQTKRIYASILSFIFIYVGAIIFLLPSVDTLIRVFLITFK